MFFWFPFYFAGRGLTCPAGTSTVLRTSSSPMSLKLTRKPGSISFYWQQRNPPRQREKVMMVRRSIFFSGGQYLLHSVEGPFILCKLTANNGDCLWLTKHHEYIGHISLNALCMGILLFLLLSVEGLTWGMQPRMTPNDSSTVQVCVTNSNTLSLVGDSDIERMPPRTTIRALSKSLNRKNWLAKCMILYINSTWEQGRILHFYLHTKQSGIL